MEPASEEGGGRAGAALSDALRKMRDGAVDSAVIRMEAAEADGASGVRAATNREEVETSTMEYLKLWMGWGRSFWFHSPDGVTPGQPMDGVLWPESGVTAYTRTVSKAGISGGVWWMGGLLQRTSAPFQSASTGC